MARSPEATAQMRNYTLSIENVLLDAALAKAAWDERPLSWHIRRLLREWLAETPPLWLGASDAGALTSRPRRKAPPALLPPAAPSAAASPGADAPTPA